LVAWDRPLGSPGQAVTLVRLEGIAASVAHRAATLVKLLAPFGTAEIVDDVVSAAIWVAVRDVQRSRPATRWVRGRCAHRLSAGVRGALGERLARDSGGDVTTIGAAA